MDEEEYIQALIHLHRGLERQGPGDLDFSNHILAKIPGLPAHPRVADIGCGAGAGALLLADRFKSRIRAVDFSREFLDELEDRAKQRGLEHWIETIECDMGSLDWEPGSIDLLWSEGAAYNLTFTGALQTWRPLLSAEGIAVISEMNYFTSDVPAAVRTFWNNAYPTIGTEAENTAYAASSDYEVLGVHRLPSEAWWDNYYGPLRRKMDALEDSKESVMQAVINEIEAEILLFAEHGNSYGYSFYILQAV